jgi:glycosyltransferase involved in cell wall biosynthesis
MKNLKRNVCFVGAEITPSEGGTFVGGSVNTVVGLCKGLTQLGWQVHIITTPSRFLKNPHINVQWAKIHVINVRGKHNSLIYDLMFIHKASKEVQRLNSENKFDIIHGHSGYFSLSIIPILLRYKLHIPTLFSLYCPESMLPTALPIDRCLIKIMSFYLDRIVAVTQNVKQSILDCRVDGRRVEVIPSCYDEQAFDIKKVKFNSNEKAGHPTTMLFVGNAHKTKGLDILVLAAKSIIKSNQHVKFIITLHEPKKVLRKARSFVARELGANGVVLGVVENMPQLVADADIIVAPFKTTDGISDVPIIILEAMAMGKPVVVSNLPGVCEAVDSETGIIISENTPKHFAAAIIKLVNDPELRQQMGKQAMKKVKSFSYTEISKKLENLYLNMVEDV